MKTNRAALPAMMRLALATAVQSMAAIDLERARQARREALADTVSLDMSDDAEIEIQPSDLF